MSRIAACAALAAACLAVGIQTAMAATAIPHPSGGGSGEDCGDMSNYAQGAGGGQWDYAHTGGTTSQAILDAGWSVHSNYTKRAESDESDLYSGLLTDYSMHDRCPN